MKTLLILVLIVFLLNVIVNVKGRAVPEKNEIKKREDYTDTVLNDGEDFDDGDYEDAHKELDDKYGIYKNI